MLEFNATAETMTETFHLAKADNYTCDVNINVHLYEDDYWGHSHVAYDNFHFQGRASSLLPVHPDLRRDGLRIGFETVTYQDYTDDVGAECMDDDYGEAEYYPYDDHGSPRTTWSAWKWLTLLRRRKPHHGGNSRRP